MAEGESNLETNISDAAQTITAAGSQLDPKVSPPTSSRSRYKLGQMRGKDYINKSFDHSTLSNSAHAFHKPIRRQSSVSDFFQSMFTKSRSHLFSLFSAAKKDNRRCSMQDIRDKSSSPLVANTAQNFISDNSSCQGHTADVLGANSTYLNSNQESPGSSEKQHRDGEKDKRRQLSPRHCQMDSSSLKDMYYTKDRTSPADMFIVKKSNQTRHYKSKSYSKSSTSYQSLSSNEDEGCIVDKQDENFKFSCAENLHRTVMTSSVVDFSKVNADPDEVIEKQTANRYRQISSAPVGRQSLSIESTFLTANHSHQVLNNKRALVKSNSDTITKLSSALTPIVKASSDGNCFQKSLPKTSVQVSTSSTIQHMCRITDYLFLGSVEVAYSEPLLCKYDISSLIDMTNISPRLVPVHKKTDCPCACVTKNHFRSRLNIGVDDIEWENLEQYFKEINAFINGARKKRGRTLVFSYMGQSRAPAAVIQHLMYHYEMSYKEAFNIVVSKRPQTKLNPGFVKSLKRLEKTLASDRVLEGSRRKLSPSQSPINMNFEENVEGFGIQERRKEKVPESVPPVVRGAWLDC